MQKTSLKASILIWATFLSLIITVTFISISTKINKNLKNNSNLTGQLEINNIIQNIINDGNIDGNYTNKILKNGEEIIFDNNNIIKSLNKGEEIIIKIIKDNKLTIKIKKGGPIIASGSLITTENIFGTTNGTNFKINNLGGYSKILISSNTKNSFLLEYTNYKIIKQIGNKEIIKSKGSIKNF